MTLSFAYSPSLSFSPLSLPPPSAPSALFPKLREGRNEEEGFKRSFELWEGTAVLDVGRKVVPDMVALRISPFHHTSHRSKHCRHRAALPSQTGLKSLAEWHSLPSGSAQWMPLPSHTWKTEIQLHTNEVNHTHSDKAGQRCFCNLTHFTLKANTSKTVPTAACNWIYAKQVFIHYYHDDDQSAVETLMND